MSDDRIRAYWKNTSNSKKKRYDNVPISEWKLSSSEDDSVPRVSVSSGPSGFRSVLAQRAGTNRTIALTLDESPKPGIYKFRPPYGDFDFEVELEYHEEPFPDAKMQTLDLQSPLCDVAVGDTITIRLRKDATESPGIRQIKGTVIEVADSCGAIPDVSQAGLDYSDYPLVSILVDFSEQTITDLDDVKVSPEFSHRLQPIGNTQGTLDVIGASEPYEMQWEGSSDTPRLPVESVTIESANDTSLTVENESLPEVQFTPLQDLTHDERLAEFKSAFNRLSNISISEDALQIFASAVDEHVPTTQLTVRYESPKSEKIQSKNGNLESVRSVYYTDQNRARHQIRFKNTTLYYLLVDSHSDAASPVSVYSKSYSRHWDTDLGEIRDITVD